MPVGRSGLKLAVTVIAVAALVAVAAVEMARAFGWEAGPLLVLVATTPYWFVVAVAAALAAATVRSWWVMAAGLVLAAVIFWWWAPAFVADPVDQGQPELTVMTTNLLLGRADPSAVVDVVRGTGADVLSVQELTEEAEQGLKSAGLDELMPYHFCVPGSGPSGTGLWSRFPLSDGRALADAVLSDVMATVTTDAGPITVVAVHPAAPTRLDHAAAEADLSRLVNVLAAIQGPTVVAGDFNATRDHEGILDLEALGFRDAATTAGAGLVRTWPTNLSPIPPLFAIDHVMTRDYAQAARRVETVFIPNSDHMAVIAWF